MNDFFIRWSVFIVIRLTMRAAVGSVILSQWFFLFYIRRHTMTTERTDEEQPFPSFAESRFSIREGDGLQTRTWRHGHSGGSFHCVLCGEQAYNHEFVSTTIFDGQQMLGDICDECVKAGPVLVGNRIRTHAADLRKEVEAFYALANDLSKLDLARWSTLDDISLASDLAQREFRRMVDERDSGTMMFRF